MKRRGLPLAGRFCATCGHVMMAAPPQVLTCSQPCTFAWLRDALRLVPNSRTGEPFIFGLTRDETRELCLLTEIVDNERLRALKHKHLEAIASAAPEVEAFLERFALRKGEVH